MLSSMRNAVQRTVNYGAKFFTSVINFPEPILLIGKEALKKLPPEIKKFGCRKLFIVSGKHVSKTDLFANFLDELKENKMEYVLFTDVEPNPTVNTVNKTKEQFEKSSCDAFVAFGGGSALDCAKIAAALCGDKRNSVNSIRGFFKVKGKLPPLFAVPTTSGTGSEVTLCAVVTDSEKGDKYSISDLKLVPKVAVLDPALTLTMPKKLTAETGMDALTHALEAYIGVGGTKYTDTMARKAVKLIFENLNTSYNDGENIVARENMALASYYAGCAFTRAFVGYVHAIAHSLGGKYNVPHGFANAVILPYVLDFYGEKINKKLSELSLLVGLKGQSQKELAEKFIEKVKELNLKMNIPTKIEKLKKEDIPELARHAIKEANPYYPVPVIMNEKQCEELFLKLL